MTANGGHQTDLHWVGKAAMDYGDRRGPGRNSLHFTLTRDFRVREKYSLSFMANVTNALNHAQFRTGSYNMGLGGSQVTDVPAQGLLAGVGQSAATYGSHNMNTFDPRRMIAELRFASDAARLAAAAACARPHRVCAQVPPGLGPAAPWMPAGHQFRGCG